MEKSLKVLLLSLALCLPAAAQEIQMGSIPVKCSSTEFLFNHIRNEWKEEVVMTGTMPGIDNIVVSVWVNNNQKSSTIVHTYKNEGMSCVVSAIENTKYVNGI